MLKTTSGKIRFHLTVWVALLMTITGCSPEKQTQQAGVTRVENEVVSQSMVLASIADNEMPDAADPKSHNVSNSASGKSTDMFIEMNRFGKGAAYLARVGDRVRVVHNGKPGKLYSEIESYALSLSPDGQRTAYGAKDGDTWYVVVDNKENGPFAEKGRNAFSPDSRHVAYEAKVGEKWFMFVDGLRNEGAHAYFDKAVFSRDSSMLVFVETTNNDDIYRLVTSDIKFRKQNVKEISSALIAVNRSSDMIAAVVKSEAKLRVIEYGFTQPDKVNEGALYDEVRYLTYSSDGSALTYIARNGNDISLVLNGKAERIPTGEYPWSPIIRPDNKGVGLVIVATEGAYVHQAFYTDGHPGGKYKECADLTYSRDGRSHAYVAIKNERFLIVTNGKEGPMFDRVISPLFSPDGKFLVYRARRDGKRFVVVADATGKIIRELPSYERIFEPIFTADGKSVAYGVKDGKQILWKVEKL